MKAMVCDEYNHQFFGFGGLLVNDGILHTTFDNSPVKHVSQVQCATRGSATPYIDQQTPKPSLKCSKWHVVVSVNVTVTVTGRVCFDILNVNVSAFTDPFQFPQCHPAISLRG